MPHEALARTESAATRNFRQPQVVRPQTGVVIFPKQNGRSDADDVLRPRGTEERASHAVTHLLAYDARITALRRSQEENAAAIEERLGLAEGNAIVASNSAKAVYKKVRRLEESTIPMLRAEVNTHGFALDDLSREVRAGHADLEEHILGLSLTAVDQEEVDAIAGQVHGNTGQIRMLTSQTTDNGNLLQEVMGRVHNIEQAFAPRPRASSGFDWKLQCAWITLIAGVATLAAHFSHLL